MDYELDYILDRLDKEKAQSDGDPEKSARYKGALVMAGAVIGHNIIFHEKTQHHRVLFSFSMDVILGELDAQMQHLRAAHKEHDQGAKAFYDGLFLMASVIVTNHFANDLQIVCDELTGKHTILVSGKDGDKDGCAVVKGKPLQ